MSIKTEVNLLYVLGRAIQIIKRDTSYNTAFIEKAEKAVEESIETMPKESGN